MALVKIKEVDSSTMWDRDVTLIFCDLCLKEVELGNRSYTYFNKEGWQNIMKMFKEMTGREYNMLQFKNKWDQLKKDWKLWEELKRGSKGLGWDPIKQTIDASEEWWAEKLEVVPTAKKFKFSGIDPDLEEKLDRMFSGVVAASAHAFTPSEQGFASISKDLQAEQVSGSFEDSSPNQMELEPTCRSKRHRLNKRKKEDVAFVKSQLIKLVDACTSQADISHDTSVDDLLRVLDETPEVYEDMSLYMNSLKLLEDPTRRQIFMIIRPEYRVGYLRISMDRKDT